MEFPLKRYVGDALAVVCLCSTIATAQQTWVVDPSGTGHFTDLAPAFAAANDGDTLLIVGGSYVSFYNLDKSLVLVGTATPRPRILWLRVQPASVSNRRVVLLNLDLQELQVQAPTSGLFGSKSKDRVGDRTNAFEK